MLRSRLVQDVTKISRLMSSLSLSKGEAKCCPSASLDKAWNKEITNFASVLPNMIIPNRLPFPVQITEKPTLYQKIIDSPSNMILNEINDLVYNKKEIQEPISERNTEKHAIRMIVIRRRKMKKHKLKKLRKRQKFEKAKIRQRREMKKEKAFQAELLGQIKEAEKFSAEEYVAEKIRKATETPIPRFWKGKRLPQFIIKQKLGIK